MLTETLIRAAKPGDKPRKLFDEKGLFLLIRPSSSRLWRLKYRFPRTGPGKREKTLALGPYPEVSLKQARSARDDARFDLRSGIDPGAKRRPDAQAPNNTFEAVARARLAACFGHPNIGVP